MFNTSPNKINEGIVMFTHTEIVNPDTKIKFQNLASIYNSLASVLITLIDSKERSYAITKLQESFFWVEKVLEREQIDAVSRKIPKPQLQQTKPQTELSAEAAMLAGNRKTIDDLFFSIKELTDIASVKGLDLKNLKN